MSRTGNWTHLSTNRARRWLTSLIEANSLTITPDHHTLNAFGLAMTLTFDIWPCKHFSSAHSLWWISVASYIEIPPLSEEIPRHAEYVLTDGRTRARPDVRPKKYQPFAAYCWQRRLRTSRIWPYVTLNKFILSAVVVSVVFVFIVFTIFTITACIFSYSFSISFWTQELALQQILSSVDFFSFLPDWFHGLNGWICLYGVLDYAGS